MFFIKLRKFFSIPEFSQIFVINWFGVAKCFYCVSWYDHTVSLAFQHHGLHWHLKARQGLLPWHYCNKREKQHLITSLHVASTHILGRESVGLVHHRMMMRIWLFWKNPRPHLAGALGYLVITWQWWALHTVISVGYQGYPQFFLWSLAGGGHCDLTVFYWQDCPFLNMQLERRAFCWGHFCLHLLLFLDYEFLQFWVWDISGKRKPRGFIAMLFFGSWDP